MPVEKTADWYKMFQHAHTIIPVVDECDITQGIVSAMVRRFGLKLDRKQVKLGRVIASEQLMLRGKKNSATKHFLHLVMSAGWEDIPAAVATAADMLGISPAEKVGIVLNKKRPGMSAAAENVAAIERFKNASIVLL